MKSVKFRFKPHPLPSYLPWVSWIAGVQRAPPGVWAKPRRYHPSAPGVQMRSDSRISQQRLKSCGTGKDYALFFSELFQVDPSLRIQHKHSTGPEGKIGNLQKEAESWGCPRQNHLIYLNTFKGCFPLCTRLLKLGFCSSLESKGGFV